MYKVKNPYRPIRAEVIDTIVETENIKTIRLKPDESMSFKTGQFIELTVPGVGEAPFTPSSRPSIKDMLEISVMKVGKVTSAIHELKNGDIVGIRGPFGNGYPIQDFKGKEILIVGGGCGFAPLRSLMYEFFEHEGEFKKLFFRGGCKTSRNFLYRSELEQWAKRKDLNLELTVDEADSEWKWKVGVVTTILDDVDMDFSNGIAIVCGPPIMMKYATKKLIDMGFKDKNIYLSMERNMSCGIGKCGHCRLGVYYTCKDGPVFRYDTIRNYPDIWE